MCQSRVSTLDLSVGQCMTKCYNYQLLTVPVSARIDLKILFLVFKVLNGLGPLYLSELLRLYIPNRN